MLAADVMGDDHLLHKALAYQPGDLVHTLLITGHKGVPHKLWIDVAGRENYSGTDAVQQILKELGLEKDNGWQPESIKITVVFRQTGAGRRKQVTATITPPNTCDLKNRTQDDIVRKLLKDWDIYTA